MSNNFKYNIQARELKSGRKVYDVFFYVYTPEGRKHKRLCGFETKKLAKQAYEKYITNLLVAPQKYEGKYVVSYEIARQEYLNAVRPNIKESSYYDFVHNAKAHYDKFFAGRDMRSLTKQDVYAWQELLWAKKHNGKLYSQAYLSKIHQQFTAFYRWCVMHYEFDDILVGVQMPKRRDNKEPRRIWTEHDFETFIESVSTLKYKAIFTTLFYCGCRIGELQTLTPSDFDGESLYIHATFTRKTMDGSPWKITETKNYKSRRVPLPQKALDVLNEWLRYKEEYRIPNKFIFGSNSPISLNAVQSIFTRGINNSGVTRIRIHDLRHSYVSLLMAKGVNFGVIAALIGDTLEQVVKTYAHHVEDDKIKAVALL